MAEIQKNTRKPNWKSGKKGQIILKTSNDPIADLLTRIKNGINKKKDMVIVPYSKIKESIITVLLEENYINHFEVLGKSKKYFAVYLKYTTRNQSTIRGLKRVSKPGLRVYSTADKLPYVLRGMGTAIISTSSGIMTDEKARSHNVGGEVIAFVW